MSSAAAQLAQSLDVNWPLQWTMVNGAIGRLVVASLLGGIIGVEREAKRRSAGVRTNLLIALGAAFFTLLSIYLAGAATSDKSRIASNIVQGIGFLGAGLIIHNRSRISGLTSAAVVWVVASIGMACGAGLYGAAVTATFIVLVAVELVGFLERRANLKTYSLVYEARGSDQTAMLKSILDALDKSGERLLVTDKDAIGNLQRVSFSVTATKNLHARLHHQLLAEQAIDALLTFRDPEED